MIFVERSGIYQESVEVCASQTSAIGTFLAGDCEELLRTACSAKGLSEPIYRALFSCWILQTHSDGLDIYQNDTVLLNFLTRRSI